MGFAEESGSKIAMLHVPYSIILVKPQLGENIGAAARIMANFGIDDLRIVAPRDGWPNQQAIDMAANASKLVENAKIFQTLEEASSDLQFLYALTARERQMDKQVISSREIILREHTGFVFGAERTGLTNDEISLCDQIISIPVDEKYKSINLAQSVAIICYEISEQKIKTELRELANKDELNSMFDSLFSELEKRGYFQEENKKAGMITNIRTMFTRAEFSSQEVKTLRGIVNSLLRKG